MKKAFDIKYRPQIESGEYKVVTADDHPVRICCWDAEEYYPIVALVKDYNEKSDYCYPMMCDTEGVSATKGKEKTLYVVTPEPELTEFEKVVRQVFIEREYNGSFETEEEIERVEKAFEESARHYAVALLAAAKKHLDSHYDQEIEEAYKEADRVQYNKGYAEGKADVLKDTPKWCKILIGMPRRPEDYVGVERVRYATNPDDKKSSNTAMIDVLRVGNRFVCVNDLVNKLIDEE